MILKNLYINGMIFTSNNDIPYAEAMSISVGAVDYVGTTQGLLESVGLQSLSDPKISDYNVIDLKGKTVIPGFIDGDIRSIKDVDNQGMALAEKGITALACEASYEDQDIFDKILNYSNEVLPQKLSLYYPWEFVKNNPEVLSDKTRMIRSRKIHVAGITVPGERELSKEDEEAALEFCKNNFCQLSVKVSEDDPSIDLLKGIMEGENWLGDSDQPNIRIHRGEANFDPFLEIKNDLMAQARKNGDDSFISLDSEIIGYTKMAANYGGFVDIGEIKKGGKADFLVLDRELSRIAISELDQVHPEVTIMDGIAIYKKDGSELNL